MPYPPQCFTAANAPCHSNGSQFFITTVVTSWLDGKHVVFGEVADQNSMNIVKAIEATDFKSHPNPKMRNTVVSMKPTIVKSGEQQ